MRKSVRVELDTTHWNKLRSIALDSNRSVEDEANLMLKNYVQEKSK